MSLAATSGGWAGLARSRAAKAFVWQDHAIELDVARQALEKEWRALDAAAVASIFQGFDFIDGWCRHAATAAGEEPLLVTGRRNGALRFILPLAVGRRYGARTLCWLAQSHANYGMALMWPEAAADFDPARAEDLMAEIARRSGAAVIFLDNQPTHWAGRANAFAIGPRAVLTANDTFVLTLEDDFKTQYQRLFSGRTRSGLKRKQRRLEDEGSVSFEPPSDPAARGQLLDWFATQKRDQLAEEGQKSVFDRPAIAALYQSFAAAMPAFAFDHLAFNDQPVAIALTIRSGRDTCLINSAHLGGDFARFSPGTLLLHATINSMHQCGVRTFDFGPGALPYKLEWEPQTIPLMARTMAISLRGVPAKAILTLAVTLKRVLKRSDRLRPLAFALRRRLGRFGRR